MSQPTTAPALRSKIAADALSGFLVSLIALPLCLGIALASGFPPVAGVLTAVVGGLLGPFLGSARLTIKGPAAGLIVIVLGAVADLGQGDVVLGYRRALAVGVVAAAIQVVFALIRLAKLGEVAPPSVVRGMLAAIGVIIFAKQAHVLMGVTPRGDGPLALLAEIPSSVTRSNPEVLLVGIVGVVLLLGWPWVGRRLPKLTRVPAPLLVLLAAVPVGLAFSFDTPHDGALFGHAYHVGPELLLDVPTRLLDVITFPDFSVIFTPRSMQHVAMFALVGSLESALSVLAVDGLDPDKRSSNLDRDLLAVGVGNLIAASLGGLPMISEIVRSKANIDNGAKTAWANFFHGLFLLLFVASVPALLRTIPLAALAAMLVVVGARLASFEQLVQVERLGLDQLLLFGTTLLVTLAVDLLVGIAAGVLVKLALDTARARTFVGLFRTRVTSDRRGPELAVTVKGPATFLSVTKVMRACAPASDPAVERVVLDVSAASLVDHTLLARIHAVAREWPTAELTLRESAALEPVAPHPLATRRAIRRE